MKLTLLLALALPVCSFKPVSSQQVNAEFRNATLREVFRSLKQQTGIFFVFSEREIDQKSRVSVKLIDLDLDQALDEILKDLPYTHERVSEMIVIRPAPGKRFPQARPMIRVTGTVRDATGQPMPGVTVVLKNTRSGTATDQEGRFSISVLAPDDILVFSFIGMTTREVALNGETEIHVTLEEQTEDISEVVVTGIFRRTKESFTGSSSTFTAKELKSVGNQNLLQSLRTLDPSFAIVENNQWGSDPNRLPDIEIRGKSSVIGLTEEFGTDPNQPLFILDGFETTLATISDLSMDRVESITILKDAASTAIYGSKAANGIVVVETRKPAAGQLKVNYNGNFSFTWADLSDYNLMNAMEKITFEKLSGRFGRLDDDGNLSDYYETSYYPIYNEVLRGVDSYWLSEPLRFAVVDRHNLFVEGGDEYMRYGVNFSYGKTRGVMKGSDRNVINGNARLMYRRGALSVNNTFSVDNTVADRETVSFSRFARANPYFRKRDANGDLQMVLSTERYSTYNPLWDMTQNSFDRATTFSFTNQFELDWRVIEELRARVRFGISKSADKGTKYVSYKSSEFAGRPAEEKGSYSESNAATFKYDGDVSLTYGTVFNDKHRVNAVGGFNFSENNETSGDYTVTGFTDDMLARPSAAMQYKAGTLPGYSDSKRRTASFFLNTGYSYDDRYLLDANYRSDGTSIFGVDRHFKNTWSVGLAWNIHHEPFLQAASGWLGTFKLRFSVGNPGNQNFSDYISVRVYGYNFGNPNPFGVSMTVTNFANEGLEWQRTLDRNFGLDLVLFNNRTRLNLDYFHKKTDPLLVYVGVPTSTGVDKVPRNLAEQYTRGWTLVANHAILQREHLTWSVNLSARHVTSKYRGMGDALKKFNLENQGGNLTRYRDGGSPSDLWAVRSLGIDPGTGREVFLTRDGEETFLHDYNDEVVVGNSEPTVEGVFGSSFRYRGFSASFNFRYRVGGQIFMETLYKKVEVEGSEGFYNQDKRALYDRWQKPGDSAKFLSIAISERSPMSSRFVMDNNILAGESISFGYETQARWLHRAGASSMVARAYMNDIFRLSTVKNERGIDYPFSRSVSFSLGFRF
jgi:TonB-linked SusC/RagA family outer membrane protein